MRPELISSRELRVYEQLFNELNSSCIYVARGFIEVIPCDREKAYNAKIRYRRFYHHYYFHYRA